MTIDLVNRVPGVGPKNPKIAIIGIGPAKNELLSKQPFTGDAGGVLNRALNSIGKTRNDAWLGNFSEYFVQPGISAANYLPRNIYQQQLERLKLDLLRLQPNVVMALGDEVLNILCGVDGITNWRGSILPSTLIPGLKVVASVHPAWIVRGMWKWEPVFKYVDLVRAFEESLTSEINYPVRKSLISPTFVDVIDYIHYLNTKTSKHDFVSLDIEVFGYTKHGMGEIACVGVGCTISEAICIPFVRNAGATQFYTTEQEIIIWQALAKLLQNPRIKIIGQNLAFEYIYFWTHGIYPTCMWIDTMLVHHTLYPDFGKTEDIWSRRKSFDEPGHSLQFINSQYTRTPYYKDDGRRWLPGLGDSKFWNYNTMDVMVTADAALQMFKELHDEKLWDFYDEYHRKVFLHCLRMEWFGILQDMTLRESVGKQLEEEIFALTKKIKDISGRDLNVNSPKQLQEYLYVFKGYDPQYAIRKTPQGIKRTITTNAEALLKLADKTQDPVLLVIKELRSKKDLKSDIIDQILGDDNRMHCHYKQGGTDSNRWSSTESIMGTGMNLMNLPREGVARCLFLPS